MYGLSSHPTLKILLSGLNGLGNEIVKNLILDHFRHITLHDTKATTYSDLGSHCYLSEKDIGHNRAQSTYSRIQPLYPSAELSVITTRLTEKILLQHNIVILVDTQTNKAITINEFCHAHSILFLKADAKGLAGEIFCDFGDVYKVLDKHGNCPVNKAHISQISEDGWFRTHEQIFFHLGDTVKCSEFQGIDFLNEGEFEIGEIGDCQFKLRNINAINISSYHSGGIVTLVKSPPLHFSSLKDALEEENRNNTVLFQLFRVLDEFQSENDRYPRQCSEDIRQMMDYWKEFYGTRDTSEEEILKKFVHGCSVIISPIASIIGGIVAMECAKAASRTGIPIQQWFHFDAIDTVIPGKLLDSEEYQPQSHRYDNQIQLFGKTFQEKLFRLKYLLAECGPMQYEVLKNFALMGVGCGDNGWISLVDDEVVAACDQRRELVFSVEDLGKQKAACAILSAKSMNPSLHIDVFPCNLHDSDSANREMNRYNWDSVNGIISVVSGKQTVTSLMDSFSVLYEIPMIYGSVCGRSVSVGVTIPHKTKNYEKMKKPQLRIPMEIYAKFPHNIQRCIKWAKIQFKKYFYSVPVACTEIVVNSKTIADMNLVFDIVFSDILSNSCNTWKDCVHWARENFDRMYGLNITLMTQNYPSNHVMWSPPRRYPAVVKFDCNDPLHVEYIYLAAKIRAAIFQIEWPFTYTEVNDVLEALTDYSFQPLVVENSLKQYGQVRELIRKIPEKEKFLVHGQRFQKWNFDHLRFVIVSANLRARNFNIEEVDEETGWLLLDIREYRSLSAVAAGLQMLELCKITMNCDYSRRYNYNNGNNILDVFELEEVERIYDFKNLFGHSYISFPPGHTVWSKIEIMIPVESTLQDLVDYFATEYDLILTTLSYGTSILYGITLKHSDRLPMKLVDLVKEKTGEDVDGYPFLPILTFEKAPSHNEVVCPSVVITFIRYSKSARK